MEARSKLHAGPEGPRGVPGSDEVSWRRSIVKRCGIRRHPILIAAGSIVAAVLIAVLLVAWLVNRPPGPLLHQDGIYRYGSATIAVEGYWTGQTAAGHVVVLGYFPILRVAVSCTENCSLRLEPAMHYPGSDTRNSASGQAIDEKVDLIAGETKSLVWAFEAIDSGSVASGVEIKVSDLSGQEEPGIVTFRLEAPTSSDPQSKTKMTAPAVEPVPPAEPVSPAKPVR
jgi:hypothetical protein